MTGISAGCDAAGRLRPDAPSASGIGPLAATRRPVVSLALRCSELSQGWAILGC